MALTVLTDGSTVNNTRTLTWTIPGLAIGDVAVVVGSTWDAGDALLNTPTGTGLTFTQRVFRATTSKVYQSIWTAVASSGGSNVVVTSSQTTATATMHTGVLYHCPTADGYSLAGTPNTASAVVAASSPPQVALTGTSGNLGIGAIGDWAGNLLTGRAYVNTTTEDLAAIQDSTQVYFHQTLTGASTTVGLSTPDASAWDILAIEVIKGAGAPAVPPPELVMAPRRPF